VHTEKSYGFTEVLDSIETIYDKVHQTTSGTEDVAAKYSLGVPISMG